MAEDDLRVRVHYALAVFPALMRESIMNDESFAHHASLISTQNIALHKAGVSFQRSSFYSGIRDALVLSDNVSTITDDAGQDWLVSIENHAGQRYTRLKSNDRVIHLPDFWALSPDSNTRMKGFEREVCELNFIGRRSQEFRDLLERGPLDEDQFDLLNLEFEATPVRVAASIRRSIDSDGGSIEELVPGNRNYFERLVGVLQADDTLYLYANNSARKHVDQLFSWGHDKGIKFALLMSSHSLIVANIDIKLLSAKVVEETFGWVLKSGDMISKLGAIELGLRNLDLFPQLEPYVESIIRQVVLDDPDDESGRFSLLSALVVMVSGEVARLNILSGFSPFWVRLAIIAHASLIEREIISSSLSTKEIVSWCLQVRGNFYYWKSLLELRVEPRWQPDFISSSQIRFEFLGRISSACAENSEKIKTESLRQLLLGEGGVKDLLEFPFPYLPGPLEGDHVPDAEMPPEIFSALQRELEKKNINANSFAALVNFALVFRIGSAHADLAANALRKVKYQLRQTEGENNLLALIDGLAKVAAVTRSKDLGDEVRVLSRVTRRRKGVCLSSDGEVRIAMIAAASRKDLMEWVDFLGAWITEIAFEARTADEARVLLLQLRRIVGLQPELIVTCSKAEAALLSIIAN